MISPSVNPFPYSLNLRPYHISPSPQKDTEFGLVSDDLSKEFEIYDTPIAIAL